VQVVDAAVVGEARTAARAHLAALVARLGSVGPQAPTCIISSGETTVHVTGTGRGGRNQEFALALVEHLATLGQVSALASLGTDGVDGPTDAAGAIVDSSSSMRAERAGLAPSRFLDDNNAYAFFAALGDLINIGPTGTNVGDLQVILLA
jgi:hydroxypyruvate reductase